MHQSDDSCSVSNNAMQSVETGKQQGLFLVAKNGFNLIPPGSKSMWRPVQHRVMQCA